MAQGGGVPVVFELGKHCSFGNSFAIIGEAPSLGAWDPRHAAKMEVRGHSCYSSYRSYYRSVL
jgi:hypothetical protein